MERNHFVVRQKLTQHCKAVTKRKVKVSQSCLTLCHPTDCSPPGSSVHGILQARVLEWVTIIFSRASSWPRDGTQVSGLHCRQILYHLSHQGSPKQLCSNWKNWICWSPDPCNVTVLGGRTFWSWWGHEGGTLLMGLVLFQKEVVSLNHVKR